MIRRVLYGIAGVDRDIIVNCPATDRLWAAHLGLSLCLSFTVVFGASLYAIGYLIDDVRLRLPVAGVVALTVLMFDRALFQSDWFYQGAFTQEGRRAWNASIWQAISRALRISTRLAISFGLAWVIAIFLELAIFSDTIGDKIKLDYIAANHLAFQKIIDFEKSLSADLSNRRNALARLETSYQASLINQPAQQPESAITAQEVDGRLNELNAAELKTQAELRETQEAIKGYAADMNAEALGKRLNANNSGRPGVGPRYEFAKRQKDVFDTQRLNLERELVRIAAQRTAMLSENARRGEQQDARRAQELAVANEKQDALRKQTEIARAAVVDLEQTRLQRIDQFRQKTMQSADFQKLKDDPLARLTAYEQLKADPKDGAIVSLLSWMTRFLVIFLEIVPVIAKIFFSPPSVYALRISNEVERQRQLVTLPPEMDVQTATPPQEDRNVDQGTGAPLKRPFPKLIDMDLLPDEVSRA